MLQKLEKNQLDSMLAECARICRECAEACHHCAISCAGVFIECEWVCSDCERLCNDCAAACADDKNNLCLKTAVVCLRCAAICLPFNEECAEACIECAKVCMECAEMSEMNEDEKMARAKTVIEQFAGAKFSAGTKNTMQGYSKDLRSTADAHHKTLHGMADSIDSMINQSANAAEEGNSLASAPSVEPQSNISDDLDALLFERNQKLREAFLTHAKLEQELFNAGTSCNTERVLPKAR